MKEKTGKLSQVTTNYAHKIMFMTVREKDQQLRKRIYPTTHGSVLVLN